MRNMILLCLLALPTAGCAALPLLGTVAGDAAAAAAGVSAVQEFISAACAIDTVYADVAKDINNKPNATVQQIATDFGCGTTQ